MMQDIKTERLILVPVDERFIDDVFENFNESVNIYMYPAVAKNIDETKAVIDGFIEMREKKSDYVYAITLKSTGEFIGLAGLHNLKNEAPELGIWTKKQAHGNHFGREAIGALLKLAKEMGYKSAIYPVDRRNIASKKIPIFYGGILIEGCEEVSTPDGRILEKVVYSIRL